MSSNLISDLTKNDTITAVSTPKGTGAIAVIRISGQKAFKIADALFHPASKNTKIKNRVMTYGTIQYKKEKIDEVLLTRFPSPYSFTGEDMVEISCHGGLYITSRIYQLLIYNGARSAEPGEFTKRAFLNGKIDLAQAEAVQAIISAKSEKAGNAALKILKGELSEKVRQIKDQITDILARISVSIDYPEYDETESDTKTMIDDLNDISARIKTIINTYRRGRIYNDGVRVVIVGRPNVGKSTFLNSFTGKNRAIVTDIPGTTRDTIEEQLELNGISVILTDTAGLRETNDSIEKIGQEKTKEALDKADMIILILDSNEGYFSEEEKIMREYKHKHMVLLLNKIDKIDEKRLKSLEKEIPHSHLLSTSLINNKGIEQIEAMIIKILEEEILGEDDDIVITQQRQLELFDQSKKSLDKSVVELEKMMPIDMAEPEIRHAAESLGKILGEDIDDEIINKVFSKFCLGK